MASSRTNFKMMLQRDQFFQEEKKSKNSTSLSSQSSTLAISLPTNDIPQPVLPSTVLQVETGLQNPTKYHVRETQRNQVANYLSQSQGASKNSVRMALAPRMSAPSGDGFHNNNVPASPFSHIDLSASADNQSDNVSDIFDDMINYDSSCGDESRLEPSGSNVATVSPNNLKKFNQNSALSVVTQENTSSSCPTIKQELPEDDYRSFNKERQKKDNHNIIERRRRYNINDRIRELGQLVPKSLDPDARWNKGTILKAAVDHIQSLQKDQMRIRQAEIRAQEMESINKQLQMRIQQLEAGFHNHGIPLPPFDTSAMHDGMNHAMTPFNQSSNPSNFHSGDNRLGGNYSLLPLSPAVPSPNMMPTHPQSSTMQSGQMQSNGSPHSNYLPPRPQLLPQQHLVSNQTNMSPHGHQMSPNVSNRFCFSPLPAALSPQTPMRHLSETSNTTSGIFGSTSGDNMGNYDMNTFDYGNMGDGSYSAMLTSNDTAHFNDVMMNDYSAIKDDRMLSDATNRQ